MKNLKKNLLTSLAAIALMAPLALSGMPNIHAANVNHAKTTAQQPSRSSAKHTISMAQFKQILAKQKAAQAKALKGSKVIFLKNGNMIYTVRAKKNQMFPTTMKKYASLKKFKRIVKPKVRQFNQAYLLYQRTRRAKYRKIMQKNLRYVEIAQLPSKKAQQQINKKQRNRKLDNKKRSTKRRKGLKKRVQHKSNQSSSRIHALKGHYRRSSYRAAKKTGFANGPVETNIHTMFDRYQPTSRRAVIPKHYRIYPVKSNFKKDPSGTVWLVGRHTNNQNKINQMKKAYYYNQKYHGWIML